MANWKRILSAGESLSDLGGGSGSTFLRKDGNWATPTNTNTTYSIAAYDNNPASGIVFTPSSGGATTIEFTDGDLYYNTSGNNIEAGIMDGAITRSKMANDSIRAAEIDTNNNPTASNQFLGYVPA